MFSLKDALRSIARALQPPFVHRPPVAAHVCVAASTNHSRLLPLLTQPQWTHLLCAKVKNHHEGTTPISAQIQSAAFVYERRPRGGQETSQVIAIIILIIKCYVIGYGFRSYVYASSHVPLRVPTEIICLGTRLYFITFTCACSNTIYTSYLA